MHGAALGRTPWISRAVARHALDRAGLVALGALGLTVGIGWALSSALPVDTDMYWRASSGGPIYGTIWGTDAASRYVYPPPLAQVLQPVHAVGWPTFVALWTTVIFLCLWGSLRWWSLPVLAVSGSSLLAFGFGHAQPLTAAFVGNVQSVIALGILLGFRWPATWAFVLLTKIGPGIGILWFAMRGEWRKLAIALGATAVCAGVSFVVDPGAWSDFARFAIANINTASPLPVVPIPFPMRLLMSIGLIAWGARTDHPWTVPIAAGWASLALYEWSFIGVWVAALPLLGRKMNDRGTTMR